MNGNLILWLGGHSLHRRQLWSSDQTVGRGVLLGAGVFAAAAMAGANPPARTKLFTSAVASPICIASTGADQGHVYICGQAGVIRALNRTTGEAEAQPFLDITARVDLGAVNGLLGMAFDPGYGANGYFYVNYNAPGGFMVLERYHAAPGQITADPDSAYTIWKYARPPSLHNGGWVGFSPASGYMYISSGDGDPFAGYDDANRAQTVVNQPMGKILRIDPYSDDFPADPDRNYHVPPSNPFAAGGGDGEIWAYGVRNPWRCSFDRQTGDLFMGDVGAGAWEEVDFEPASSPGGRNYGWPCMEGSHCTPSAACTCGDPALTLPLYEYPHSVGGTVIGGYVYRGLEIPALQGLYVFGDYLAAKFWTFRPPGAGSGGVITEFQDRTTEFTAAGESAPISGLSAFGEDAAGELYICSIYAGRVYKVVPYPCLPEVDVNPTAQTRPAGSAVSLRVAGAGADPLTFAWLKDGTPLEDDARIQGSRTAVLTIGDARVGDTGEYWAVLTSPCGSTPSGSAQLVVFACGGADFNGDGRVSIQDLFNFLEAWFAGDPRADADGNESISINDLFAFLQAWFSGCP